MAIPIIYNIRSIKVRYASSLVAICAIAGVVSVFVAVLAMAAGFQKTLKLSGSPKNAIILRGGATTELESGVTLEQVKIIADAPGIERDSEGRPLLSPELVVIAAFNLAATKTEANVQVRGVSSQVFKVRPHVKIVAGRFFQSGLTELVVGAKAANAYENMKLGQQTKFAGQQWTVVGIMDSGGSSLDSEIWCDAVVLSQAYKREQNEFQSITVRLESPAMFPAFKASLEKDPRLTVAAKTEIAYFEGQSEMISRLIQVLGFLVASVMGIGAIFGALNTMYSAVSARAKEIATLRAIGFPEGSILLSFILESMFIAGLGGILGCLLVLPIHGNMASTINWQTFSHVNFSFTITSQILLLAMGFALFMGFLGGLLPAYRASRMPIAFALRGL